jgi:translation initiation factor 2 subunit 2
MDYNKLLERARKNLPESVLKSERFEYPKVIGHIQGNRTIISNFYQIADALHREPQHLLKYVLKELATPGELKTAALLIGTKVPASRINEKIAQYVREFVLCPECKRPDTKLSKEDKIMFMKCQACGARHAIKIRI